VSIVCAYDILRSLQTLPTHSYDVSCHVMLFTSVAAYYGKGVYFAVDADYSSQEVYSPADDNGCKYIYSCLALTGEYTKGDPSMTVPPAKNPEHNEAILYDSLVDNMKDPRIFVAVKDNQVYPQYLIVFRMKF